MNFFSSKFHVFFTFHAISNIKKKKKNVCKKKFGGGGGGGVEFFFFLNSFSFHVLCYFQH